jgi:hypothetical protein
LHLKLTKLYLKTNAIKKALKHLMKLETTQTRLVLTDSQQWHKTVIDLIEYKLLQIKLDDASGETSHGRYLLN